MRVVKFSNYKENHAIALSSWNKNIRHIDISTQVAILLAQTADDSLQREQMLLPSGSELHRSIPVTTSVPPEICYCKTCSFP